MTSGDQTKVLVLGDMPRVAARFESESFKITLYGSPAINGRPARSDDLAKMESNIIRGVRSLDGEFILISETASGADVATDRFASRPLFYLVNGNRIVISIAYSSLWKWLNDNDQLKPDRLAFYGFLHIQRLFGQTTFDHLSRTLPPASLLSFDSRARTTSVNIYWIPDFTKRSDGRKAIARDLADAVRASVSAKTSDAINPSLLLSGGMDSRVALGGFPQNNLPHCITIGETENNDVDVGRSLANLVGADHSYVSRPHDHYANIFTNAVSTGGGMYSFQHGHFFDLEIPETDLILHGHGFDYFFQGMYLPATRKKFLGRPTRSYSLDPISPGIPGHYTQQAKYRLKGIIPLDLLDCETATQALDRLVFDLYSVLDLIADTTADPYDQWDYLTTSAPGRHYTYLNLLSANTLAEQRTIAFSNDILDIYYSTPATVRHGTSLLAATIRQLNSRLLEVRNANTNMRPDLSPTLLTLNSWARGLKRRLGMNGPSTSDPAAKDRSWPSDSDIANSSSSIRERIANLHQSPGIKSIDLFDESRLKKLTNDLQSGDTNSASAVLSLLTIDEFLAPTSSI